MDREREREREFHLLAAVKQQEHWGSGERDRERGFTLAGSVCVIWRRSSTHFKESVLSSTICFVYLKLGVGPTNNNK